MKKLSSMKYCPVMILALTFPLSSFAAPMGHEEHSMSSMSSMSTMTQQLDEDKSIGDTPPSGKGREMSYQDRLFFDTVNLTDDPTVRCEQAKRGVVILDRATLADCNKEIAPKSDEK